MAKQKIDPQNIDKLVEYVGGRDNIATVTHCIIRPFSPLILSNLRLKNG